MYGTDQMYEFFFVYCLVYGVDTILLFYTSSLVLTRYPLVAWILKFLIVNVLFLFVVFCFMLILRSLFSSKCPLS